MAFYRRISHAMRKKNKIQASVILLSTTLFVKLQVVIS